VRSPRLSINEADRCLLLGTLYDRQADTQDRLEAADRALDHAALDELVTEAMQLDRLIERLERLDRELWGH